MYSLEQEKWELFYVAGMSDMTLHETSKRTAYECLEIELKKENHSSWTIGCIHYQQFLREMQENWNAVFKDSPKSRAIGTQQGFKQAGSREEAAPSTTSSATAIKRDYA